MQTGLAAALVLVTVFVGGCASNSPSVYLPSETMQLAEVREGVVVALRPVTIAGNQTPLLGAGIGAVLGGLAGNAISDHSAGGTVAGAVVGGIAGAAIENQTTRKQGDEITIRLDSNQTVAVVQQEGQGIRVGDRVRLVSEGSRTRVQRI